MDKNKLIIFVVEDNLLYQQLIAKQLESLSSFTYLFTRGEDCMMVLNEHKPELIILDNDLDGELSGLETLKLIRVTHPDLYVLIFSARPELDTVENLITYGHFDFLEKTPSAFKNLKDKVCSSEAYRQMISIKQ